MTPHAAADAPEFRDAQEAREAREAQRAQWLDDILRELPPLSAPRTLQARVFEELARRAALPWWRRSFSHWPPFARGTFVLVCMTLVVLTWRDGGAALAAYRPLLDPGALLLARVHASLELVASLIHPAAALARLVPLQWLEAALAAATALYGMLFALGAIAYQILYLRPHTHR